MVLDGTNFHRMHQNTENWMFGSHKEDRGQTMWSPSSGKKLVKGDYPPPDLVASPVSSASSWTESPPLSPLDTTLDEKIEKSDDDDIRSNFLGDDMTSTGVCDFANLFPNSCQSLMSPWIRVFDIDDMGGDEEGCGVEYNLLTESRVPRYREMRVQYLGGDLSDFHASREQYHASSRLPKRPEFSQRLYPKKRRAVSNETRGNSNHPLGFFHCSQLIGSVCLSQHLCFFVLKEHLFTLCVVLLGTLLTFYSF